MDIVILPPIGTHFIDEDTAQALSSDQPTLLGFQMGNVAARSHNRMNFVREYVQRQGSAVQVIIYI